MTTRHFLSAIALALLLASPAAAEFQNLDFEDTLLDVGSLPTDVSGLENVFNPAIVTPGWSYRVETSEGVELSTTTGPDCYVAPFDRECIEYEFAHGALIDGHIGDSTQVVMSVRGRHGDEPDFHPGQSSLQNEHSLRLVGDLEAYSTLSFDIVPVAVQTGIIPSNTQSVLVLVSSPEPQVNGIAEHFSLRFEGHEVEMHPVSYADFGDVYKPQSPNPEFLFPASQYPEPLRSQLISQWKADHPDAQTIHEGVFYAGNIETIAGMQREMAIRPERDLTDPPFTSSYAPSIALDNILFSTSPAPGPPVAVPEPSALALVALGLLSTTMKRR